MTATKAATPIGARQASEGLDMTSELGRLDKQVRELVKERPVVALLSAVAAGYLVGRILRRFA